MLKLKCISTGSKGNCYILNNGEQILLIELGVKFKTIMLNLQNFNNLSGAICSHLHNDHLCDKNDTHLEILGKPVITTENAEEGKKYQVGDFTIIPVEQTHNIKCFGYIIITKNQTLYFATDTTKITKLQNIKIDHFIVECNYIDELLDKMILKHDTSLHLSFLAKNHCGLESLKSYFNELKYKPKTINTIHASNSGIFNSTKVYKELINYADKINIIQNNKEYEL